MPETDKATDKETDKKAQDGEYRSDLLYGVLSVVNQFGGVLRERGQEYRKSSVGKLLGERLDDMYRGINERERNILDVVLSSLDELASTVRDLNADLNPANGVNGHDAKKAERKKTRKPPPSKKPMSG